MQIVYAGQQFPTVARKTIFLAGPSPRDSSHPNWRVEAFQILESLGYDGHVFSPIPSDGIISDYDAQVDWEQDGLRRADVILFWVPRDLEKLPAFATNVEFGQNVSRRNVVVGYPPNSPKNRYLGTLAERNFHQVHSTLQDTLQAALKMLGDGSERHGGECEVPLYLWKTPTFQEWLCSQKAAGNRLDGFKVRMTFGVGPKEGFLFYWGGVADLHVTSENRNKSNELVICRPGIKHTVGIYRGPSLEESYVVLVREFRSPASTSDGFIREVPGGSGFKPESDPRITAAKEFAEETGLAVEPSRLQFVGARQLAGTTTAHKAHLFTFHLTEQELEDFVQKQVNGTAYGVEKETERTYVEVWTLRDLLDEPVIDWANLGMIFQAYAG